MINFNIKIHNDLIETGVQKESFKNAVETINQTTKNGNKIFAYYQFNTRLIELSTSERSWDSLWDDYSIEIGCFSEPVTADGLLNKIKKEIERNSTMIYHLNMCGICI